MKTVDLKARPIYHRSADGGRAHVFLCMLAYYVEWHMRSKLAPMLFDDHDHDHDHDRAGGEQQARVGGATGETLTGGTLEGGEQAYRRRPTGAQLSRPDERVGDADGEPGADGGQRCYVHHAQRTDHAAAALFRSPGGQRPSVDSNGHRLLIGIATSITIYEDFHCGTWVWSDGWRLCRRRKPHREDSGTGGPLPAVRLRVAATAIRRKPGR